MLRLCREIAGMEDRHTLLSSDIRNSPLSTRGTDRPLAWWIMRVMGWEPQRPSADGRGSRSQRPDPRAPHAAPIVDGLISHVTVTAQRHPLCGQRLPLIPIRSARGPGYVVVELADGRRRSIPRSATDLACPVDTKPKVDREAPRISVRTLLPLARHVAAGLAALVVEEMPHADRSPSIAPPALRGDAAVNSAVAGPAGCNPSAGRAASRRAAASADAGWQPGDGEPPC